MSGVAPLVDRLELDRLDRGRSYRFWVHLIDSGAGRPLAIPLLVANGAEYGPVVGITAAVHGNELNGIPTIHRLFSTIDPQLLRGTIVAVPVVNLPGYLQAQREFAGGADLNRLMPGREGGRTPEVYASRFVSRVVRHFDYLIDLHTASFGRINSLYVRADMSLPVTADLARLIRPQIIVHNHGADGTLRSAAADMGIHAITVEVGDPQRFQRRLIRSSRRGIQAILAYLNMIPPLADDDEEGPGDEETIECGHSYWIYTDAGGVLRVYAGVGERVSQGETIATVSSLFGDVIRTYEAPEDGVVVGCSTNPVAQTGARIIHLGIEEDAGETSE